LVAFDSSPFQTSALATLLGALSVVLFGNQVSIEPVCPLACVSFFCVPGRFFTLPKKNHNQRLSPFLRLSPLFSVDKPAPNPKGRPCSWAWSFPPPVTLVVYQSLAETQPPFSPRQPTGPRTGDLETHQDSFSRFSNWIFLPPKKEVFVSF